MKSALSERRSRSLRDVWQRGNSLEKAVLNVAHLGLAPRLAVDWLECHIERARRFAGGKACQVTSCRAVLAHSICIDNLGAVGAVTFAAGVLVGDHKRAFANQGL
jgi:hypothetical protein